MLVIRTLDESPFSLGDVVDLIRVSFKSWQEHGLESSLIGVSEEDFKAKTSGGTILVVYDPDVKRLLGTEAFFYRGRGTKKFGFIGFLAVSPEAKRQGIATRLFEDIKSRFVSNGIPYIISDTACGAEWAIKWHLKTGFKKVGLVSYNTNNYYSIVFRYQIAPSVLWNSMLFTRLQYCIHYVATHILRNADGSYTMLGRLIMKNRRHD